MVEPYWDEKNDFEKWPQVLDFIQDARHRARWVFRGLSAYDHHLISSLDRAFDDASTGTGQSINAQDRWKYETWMLYQFKRRAHHYLGGSETPKPEDFLEWFSLMRHYEAPCRLLDFSSSFYVATYFAINNTKTDATVFCVDHTWLVEKCDSLVTSGEFFQDPQVFWKYAMRHPNASPPDIDRQPFVIPVRPFRSNDRIHVQQGLFLCPANINETFEQNLRVMFSDLNEAKAHIVKIRIKREWHPGIMHSLKEMNIGSETLYPGLGGFAASLRDTLYLLDQVLEEGRLNDAIRQYPLF